LGERRLAEMFARYGRDDVLEAFRMLQDVAERRLRAALAAWPDGVHEAEHHLDRDAGTLVRYHVRIEKAGERIHFDFSGCDDAVAAPINIRPPVAYGAVAFALIAMIDPQLPNNGGLARVIETTFRPGSVLNPHFPAPTNSYMPSATVVTEICIRALGGFAPERGVANCSLGSGLSIGGTRDDGTSFLEYELSGTAAGGRTGSDGPSGVSTLLSNVRCTPIEVIESEFPTRVLRWELVADSAGAGEFRGGLGQRRMWQIQRATVNVTLRGAGHAVAAQGIDGGLPGRCGRFLVNPDTPRERSMPALFSGLELRAGDVIVDERGGGGGVGDPRRRSPELIRADVLDGYVSPDAAVEVYGADRAALADG
jgi:N-methylhydantoinase B